MASGYLDNTVVSVEIKFEVKSMLVASCVSVAASRAGGGGDHMVSSGSSLGMKRWVVEAEPSLDEFENPGWKTRTAAEGRLHPVR